VRRREVRFQHLMLKREGRITPSGLLLGAGIGLLLAFGANGGQVKYHGWQAERSLARARELAKGDPERQVLIRESRASLLRSERTGVFPDVILQQQLGETAAALGDVANAKQHMSRAVSIDPEWKIAWWWLYYLAAQEAEASLRSDRRAAAQSALAEAESALTRLLQIDPGYRGARDSFDALQQLKSQLNP
jgi:tetratricopeptide (TPR) repeat protein